MTAGEGSEAGVAEPVNKTLIHGGLTVFGLGVKVLKH